MALQDGLHGVKYFLFIFGLIFVSIFLLFLTIINWGIAGSLEEFAVDKNSQEVSKLHKSEIYVVNADFSESEFENLKANKIVKKSSVEGNKKCNGSAKTTVRKEATPELGQRANGNIIVGAGYSGDTQQMVSQVCYNATVSSTSAQQTYIQLDTAVSFSEMENKLGISVSISGGFGMFSADAEASYLRSIQNEDYSVSLNYYEYATNNVAVQLAGYGDKALTESGKCFYNSGKNPYFGLICGDHYISSYQQGALLTMGLNIIFSSSSAKREFDEKAGATFGNIISAAESIKSVVTEYKITGSVVMHAFQIGGEPSQLSKILKKDITGKYYALTCSLTAIDDCVKAASSLLDYARDEFSTQFSFKNNTGLTPLGIAFSQYNPIEYIGLIPPVSLVTQDVILYRYQLSDKLKENQYYQRKLHPFLNKGYPVELDAAFIKMASSVLSKANSNVGVLLQSHKGAADCFNFPDKCKSIRASIDSQLYNITVSDLKFLENIKYTITNIAGMFYNTGRDLETSWLYVRDKSKSAVIAKVYYISVTDKKYAYDFDVQSPGFPVILPARYVGNSTDGGMEYIGTLCIYIFSCKADVPERKQISPFFFEAYNITNWCNELSC